MRIHRIALTLSLLGLASAATAGYDTHPRFAEFAAELQAEYKIPEAETRAWLKNAEKCTEKMRHHTSSNLRISTSYRPSAPYKPKILLLTYGWAPCRK